MTAELSPRDRTLAFIGILLALFLGALDQTIVATALPRIVESLRGVERYAWVATVYLLASTVMVPLYGRMADLISRRTIELAAICIFLAGSFLCGLAGEFGALPLIGDGMNQLIAARAIQGIGGAGLFAMAFIVIADLFPPRERGKYQGFVGAVFGVSSVLGPLAGGFLTDHGGSIMPGIEGWRWVFYVNVPFGALALWFVARRMPPLVPPAGGRFDVLGAVLLVGGVTPLILALQVDKSAHPWTSPLTLGLIASAVTLLVLFGARAQSADHPLLDLGLFRNRVFTTSSLALFLFGGAFMGLVVYLPLFLVNVTGVTATGAGAAMIPLSLGVVAGSTVSGQLVSRWGRYKPFMIGGGLVLCAGIFLLTTMDAGTSAGRATLYMVLCGLGIGPAMPLFVLAIQNDVDVRRLGQATSASQFFRSIGGTAGAAMMGAVLAVGLAAALGPDAMAAVGAEGAAAGGVPPPSAFAVALRPVFQIALVLAALGWVAAFFVPEHPLRRHFESTPGRGSSIGADDDSVPEGVDLEEVGGGGVRK